MIALELPSSRRVLPAAGEVVSLGEMEMLRVTGLRDDDEVRLGPVRIAADKAGVANVRPVDHEALQCQLGRIPLLLPGGLSLEVDVRPGKVTRDAYRILRHELESVWLGLTQDPGSPSAVPARRGPPPADLWRALAPVICEIARQPRLTLKLARQPMEVSRLRSLSSLSPAEVVRIPTGARTLLATATSLSVSTADLAVVVETMLRLANKARRWGDVETEDEVLAHLRRPPFDGIEPSTNITHGARHDARYRAVLRVRSELSDPSAIITEGLGELRLGIRAMDRLFEYWVFLRTLLSAINRFGPPDPIELSQLVNSTRGGRVRLELPAGTTVSFSGGVQIVFEPWIDHDPRLSWRGLELSAHPDLRYSLACATPDVILMAGSPRRVIVLDAKYRARQRVEMAAVEIHGKYSRLRHRGHGVVEKVIAIHPHHDYRADFAGYGHMGWCPGRELEELPWDLLSPPGSASHAPVIPDADDGGQDLDALLTNRTGPVIIVDQKWMRESIGSRRIDIAALADQVQPDAQALIIVPTLSALVGFVVACEHSGWTVIKAPRDRMGQLSRLRALVDAVGERELIIISGDEPFLATARLAPRHRVVDDLSLFDIWLQQRPGSL